MPVSSSNLASVGYDPNTQTLEVEFLHGGIYQYSDVPSSVHSGLMTAITPAVFDLAFPIVRLSAP
jgi:hypothetical protein